MIEVMLNTRGRDVGDTLPGEPCALKGARTVREERNRNVQVK
jgi:hypothetical protein